MPYRPPAPPYQMPGSYPPPPPPPPPPPSTHLPPSYAVPPQQPMGYPPPQPQYQQPIPYPPYPQTSPYPYPTQAQPPIPIQQPIPLQPSISIQQPMPTTRYLTAQSTPHSPPQILITDSLTSAPLYILIFPKREHLSSTPHISVVGPTGQQIGTIRFHSMSDDVDLVIHGQAAKLKGSSFGSSHEMVSRVPGAAKWKWEKGKCKDGKGEVVANFEVEKWGKKKKEGKFELSPSIAAGGLAIDEVVVSGIAKAEQKLRASGTAEEVQTGVDVATAIAGGGS